MQPVQCFMLEATNRTRRHLRRYCYWADGGQCPNALPGGGHESLVPIEDGTVQLSDRGTYAAQEEPAEGEDRWRDFCTCGYVFTPKDAKVVQVHLIYRRADTGEEMTLDEAPPGAMYYADWMVIGRDPVYEGPGKYVGPDGHCLEVKLPGGHYWCVDGPANNGPGWTRTGTPPKVTATPSILSHQNGGYHGWLRDGVLSDA